MSRQLKPMVGAIKWFRRPDIRAAARAASLTEAQLLERARIEADNGLPGAWAAWKPGTNPTPRGSANINVDVPAALAAGLALTTE